MITQEQLKSIFLHFSKNITQKNCQEIYIKMNQAKAWFLVFALPILRLGQLSFAVKKHAGGMF